MSPSNNGNTDTPPAMLAATSATCTAATTATTTTATEIRSIPADTVRRIVAGQAVSDLASAVKELVDNALDAGSKNINSTCQVPSVKCHMPNEQTDD